MIDDAIVVVEDIVLHRDAGQTRLQAIHIALGEITIPLISSTITPIVVFLSLVSITGVTGTFFRALAVTMSVSPLTSLALALSWTPALSQFLIKRSTGDSSDIPDGIAENNEDALDQIAMRLAPTPLLKYQYDLHLRIYGRPVVTHVEQRDSHPPSQRRQPGG